MAAPRDRKKAKAGRTRAGRSSTRSAGTAAAGQAAFNAVGRVAQPIRKAMTPAAQRSVKTLENAGVPLDAAQMTGSPVLQRVRSLLTDNPVTVGGQQQFAQAQKTAFNRAVLEKVGAASDVADEATMGAAYSRISQTFNDVLDRTSIRFSSAANNRAQTIIARSKRVLGDDPRIPNIIAQIQDYAATNGGKLDGRFYQTIRGDLGALERVKDISPIARELRESLDDAFQQAAKPGDAAALQEARRQWRNMRIVENAVDSEGNISPAKLANQFGIKRNRYAGVYGKGDRSILELAQLAKAGKNVIPDKLPNSGTTARSLMQIAAPAVAGGVYGGYKEGDWSGVGAGLAGGAAVPFLMQRGMQSPTVANFLANGISNPAVRNALMGPSRIGLGATVPALLLSQQ